MTKKRYEASPHAKYRLRYHLIFSTKFRRKCLNDIKEDVKKSFMIRKNNIHYKILEMELDEDHIHFFMKWNPSLSISQVVRYMKQNSTKYLWDNCKEHLSKFYWGRKKQIWTGGYFCSTIGEVSEESIKSYIKNQTRL